MRRVAAGSAADDRLADQAHAGGRQLDERGVDGRRGRRRRSDRAGPWSRSPARGVQRGRANAVIGRDTDDLDVGDVAITQPVAQRRRRRSGPRTRSTRPRARPCRRRPRPGSCRGPGAARHRRCRRRSVRGQVSTKSGCSEKCAPGSMWWSRVATAWSYPPAARCAEMARATSVPPATANEPPSQKSFWTSTTITARIRPPYGPVA